MTAGDLEKMNLPPAPDLMSALSIIWNLPQPNLDTPDHIKGCKRILPQAPDSGNNRPVIDRSIFQP